METKHIIHFYLFIILICISTKANSQPRPDEDTLNIINGTVWVPQIKITKQNTFFLQNLNQKGELRINGTWFENRTFGYDIYQNELIISMQTSDNTDRYISLNKDALDEFRIKTNDFNYHFIRGNKLHKQLKPYHYYQLIVTKNPNLKYVILRTLKRKLSTSNSNSHKLLVANKLFIINKNQLIPISGKKDLLSIFPNKRKEVKNFIRAQKIKISSKKPLDIIPVLHNFSN